MLWMILTLMTVVAAVGLAIPLIRRRDAQRAERNDAGHHHHIDVAAIIRSPCLNSRSVSRRMKSS